MKTIDTLLKTRPWIAHIDDERAEGNSIIVTLRSPWCFQDNIGCGVQGFDTLKEVKIATARDNVYLDTI